MKKSHTQAGKKQEKETGRKGKEKPEASSRNATVSRMPVPEHILSDFDLCGAGEYRERRVTEMREREGRIPGHSPGAEMPYLAAAVIRQRCRVTVLHAGRSAFAAAVDAAGATGATFITVTDTV